MGKLYSRRVIVRLRYWPAVAVELPLVSVEIPVERSYLKHPPMSDFRRRFSSLNRVYLLDSSDVGWQGEFRRRSKPCSRSAI